MHIEINASTTYDGPKSPITVNSESPLTLKTDIGEVAVVVRIKDFKLNGNKVPSDYFTGERQSQSFSIQFVVKFDKDVSGSDLLWGNDFDSPIRDLLPWGFSAAFATFKRLVDPSVDGDVYADKPYLYGPCLTSVNFIAKQDELAIKAPLEENVEETAHARQRDFLNEEKRSQFTFEKGSIYAFDFCTPYLEMSERLAVKLPGFTFDVGKYAGKTTLRYVLRYEKELAFALTFDVKDEDAAAAQGDSTEASAAQDTSSGASDSKSESKSNSVKPDPDSKTSASTQSDPKPSKASDSKSKDADLSPEQLKKEANQVGKDLDSNLDLGVD